MSKNRKKCLENVNDDEKPSQYRKICQKVVKNVIKPTKNLKKYQKPTKMY